MPSVDKTLLHDAARRIKSATNAEEIRLYGSFVYGNPRDDSDIDLLVIVPNGGRPSYELEAEAYRALRGLLLPIELKVVTREAYQQRSLWLSSIERVAREKGEVLDVA